MNRGLVCARMHSIAGTQKILTFMSWTGECQQQKHAAYTINEDSMVGGRGRGGGGRQSKGEQNTVTSAIYLGKMISHRVIVRTDQQQKRKKEIKKKKGEQLCVMDEWVRGFGSFFLCVFVCCLFL